jgi:hypothetical protein
MVAVVVEKAPQPILIMDHGSEALSCAACATLFVHYVDISGVLGAADRHRRKTFAPDSAGDQY